MIRVNNRKVLDGVMEAIGVTDEGQKLAVFRAIDKLDKFGVEGVKLLLGEGRKDESGDFTKGAGLDAGRVNRLMELFAKVEQTHAEVLERVSSLAGANHTTERGFQELDQIS